MSTKNSSDTIGKQNRGLPACREVPQTTEPPRAPDNRKLSHESHFLADFPFYSKIIYDNLASVYFPIKYVLKLLTDIF
jgi:hypothetical protein